VKLLFLFLCFPLWLYATLTDSLLIVPMGEEAWILDCEEDLSGEVILPSTHDGLPITKIYSSAFEDCSLITALTVPEGVVEIQSYAFNGCGSLAQITLPESLSVMGSSAFKDCSSLDNVILPDALTLIPSFAFWGCHSLQSIQLPANLAEFGYSAFSYCGFTSFTVPEGVIVNDGLFASCYNLTELILPDGLSSIPTHFAGWSGLTSITIPSSVERIDTYAFQSCADLVSVNLPSTLESIGYNAFKGCSSLQSIVLPDSLTSIGESNYGGFYEGANGAFEECTALKSITLPKNLNVLGKYTFRNCDSLEYVYFKGDNYFDDAEFPFLGSNPKIYFNEGANGWESSPFSLVWEMIEKPPVVDIDFNQGINEVAVTYEDGSQEYVLYVSDSIDGDFLPVAANEIQVTPLDTGRSLKAYNTGLGTSRFYKLIFSLDDHHQ